MVPAAPRHCVIFLFLQPKGGPRADPTVRMNPISSSPSISTCAIRHFRYHLSSSRRLPPIHSRLRTGMANIIAGAGRPPRKVAAQERQPPWPSPCSDRICHACRHIFCILSEFSRGSWGSWGALPCHPFTAAQGRCRAPAPAHPHVDSRHPRGPNPQDADSRKLHIVARPTARMQALWLEEQAELSRSTALRITVGFQPSHSRPVTDTDPGPAARGPGRKSSDRKSACDGPGAEAGRRRGESLGLPPWLLRAGRVLGDPSRIRRLGEHGAAALASWLLRLGLAARPAESDLALDPE